VGHNNLPARKALGGEPESLSASVDLLGVMVGEMQSGGRDLPVGLAWRHMACFGKRTMQAQLMVAAEDLSKRMDMKFQKQH